MAVSASGWAPPGTVFGIDIDAGESRQPPGRAQKKHDCATIAGIADQEGAKTFRRYILSDSALQDPRNGGASPSQGLVAA